MSEKLPPKILVIETDEALNISVVNAIERSWFDVVEADNIDSAQKAVIHNSPNMALISSRINNITAIEVAQALRKINKFNELPILFLIDAEEAPANYYLENGDLTEVINRPFTPFELITKIKALLKKSQPVFQDKIIRYKDVTIDLATYKVTRGNQNIHLGPTEFKILQLLMQSPRVIFSRQMIINYVWGENQDIELRTVDVHINRLRTLIKNASNKNKFAKIRDSSLTNIKSSLREVVDDKHFIKTVRSGGYCLNLPGEIE